MILEKKTIFFLLISLWLVFSFIYIALDVWDDFKDNQLLKAYEEGRTEVVGQIIENAEECQSFSVYNNEKEVQLININCLDWEDTEESE